jgi:hypothetical protein
MVRLGSRRRCARKTVHRLLCGAKPEYADECGYLQRKRLFGRAHPSEECPLLEVTQT